ncbi:MAG TPA: hypothetical protein VIH11_00890 [Gemmatimonadaceae bacterium]
MRVAKARAKKKRKPRAAPKWGWTLDNCPVDAPAVELWRPEWRDHATTLLRAYNDGLLNNPTRLAAAERGHGRATLASSAGVLESLYAVHVWARRHGINPTAWARWNARRVRTVDDGRSRLHHLFDVERAELYRADAMTSVNEADARDAELHARLGASGFVAGRDLHEGAELAKRGFRERGREILCVEAYDLTFGFHPSSTICADCPLRDRCKAETAFRLGKGRP